MTFREFWPSYLRAHRLPGTRALHYFASTLFIALAIEAALAQQPMILIVGLIAYYAVAISSHWFVERNQPLIGTGLIWGAVSHLFMVRLAITGRLHQELVRHGIAAAEARSAETDGYVDTSKLKWSQMPGRYALGGFHACTMRAVLIVASAAGATAGIVDLHDLVEPGAQLHYPIIQLGVPILAFVGALIAAIWAWITAAQDRLALARSAAHGSDLVSDPRSILGPYTPLREFSDHERSFRVASLALFSIGLTSLILAEIAEKASPEPAFLWIWGFIAAGTLCALAAVLLPLLAELHRVEAASARVDSDNRPATRGILVDRREEYISGDRSRFALPFWPLLACPACGSELVVKSHVVSCSKCKVSFASDGGSAQIDLRLRAPKTRMMPFIVGDTTDLPRGIVTEGIPANPKPAIANWFDVSIPARLTDGNRLTPELLSYFPRSDEPGRWMLDLGCGGDAERAFFEQLTNLNYLGVDWTSRTADLLADAHSLPFKDEGFDLVVCIAVLEHVKVPDIVMSEARRVLKPGGLVIGTSAFLEPFHLNSYEHMTHLAIHRTLSGAGLEVILISPNRQWSGLRAQAEMSLFPIGALPRWLRRTSVAPIEVASRGAWALKRRMGKKRASELQRLVETTGGFRFVARRSS